MHATFRQIMKQTARDQHEKRREEKAFRQKHENALHHLHRITRKIPPRVENTFLKKPKKERNYLYLRSDWSDKQDNTLLRRMVDQELDKEQKELLDLAGRVGYLDPNRTMNLRSGSGSSRPSSTAGSAGGHNNFANNLGSGGGLVVVPTRTASRLARNGVNSTS